MDVVVAGSRDAIMMVEAGASEVSEADFLARARLRPRRHRRAHRDDGRAARARRSRTARSGPRRRPKPEAFERAKKRLPATRSSRPTQTQGKKARANALDEIKKAATEALAPANCARSPTSSSSRSRRASPTPSTRSCARWPSTAAASTCAASATSGRSRSRPASCPARTAPRCSRAARPRRSWSRRSARCRDQQIVDGLMEEYSKKFDLQYNFPPYQHRRGQADPRHEPPGDRPRQPRRARADPGDPARHGLPVHAAGRQRDPREQRIVLDGVRLRRDAVADGRRAVRSASRSRASRWASSRKATASRSSPTSSATEDHLGDMDFKVAGTGRGITAVQMDIKIAGITREIMSRALDQAREGRLFILKKMLEAMPMPRERDQPVRAAPPDREGRPGEDRPDHRPGRQDDQEAPGGDRRDRSTSATTAPSTSRAPTPTAPSARRSRSSGSWPTSRSARSTTARSSRSRTSARSSRCCRDRKASATSRSSRTATSTR